MVNLFEKYKGKHVLLLQGPMGPFFKRLSLDLIEAGANVYKINFNGGDWVFYPNSAINFSAGIEEWPDFLADCFDRLKIDQVILFGDCRAYHRDAISIAKLKSVPLFVFEEGYYRPDYVTFESCGVSNNSKVSRNPNDFSDMAASDVKTPTGVGEHLLYVMLWSFIYYLFSALLWPFFNSYRHHRNLKPNEILYWLRSFYRKIYFMIAERNFMRDVVEKYTGDIFVVPLQVNVDSQILFHSHYASTRDFIRQTLLSFKQFSPNNTKLILKHHPLDRGYHNYSSYINRLVKEMKLAGRVFYVFEQSLPRLFLHARGAVVINSTSGLAAIDRGLPVKVCGNAIYSVAGLVYKGSVNNFWKRAHLFKVDRALYDRYKSHLILTTQINGNFYRRIKHSPYHCGFIL